jgi:uncharacterized membrane protein YbhN (UPF0104 family)
MVRWVIRAGVSGIVVAILLTFIPLADVLDALGRVSAWAWAASVAVFFCGHYLNALKLRLLLGPAPGLMSACVRAQYAGLVANLGLPGLASGDFVRAAYLAPVTGMKRVVVASVADRLIDTCTVMALVVMALPLAGVPPAVADLVQHGGLWIAAGAGLLALAGLMLLRMPRFAGMARTVADAWCTLKARRAPLAGAIAISVVVQSAFVLTNVALARQVGEQTGLAAWFVAWPLSKLIAILPISLGGIGVREAALVSLLAPYGAAREAVLASGILWQAVLIVTGLSGLVLTQLLPRTTATPTAQDS